MSKVSSILTILLASLCVHAKEPAATEFLNSGQVVPTTLPFSEAVRAGDTLYLSGHIGTRPGTQELVSGGIAAEARQVMENIRTSLEVHGYSLENVVKCIVMLADIAEWADFNEVYQTFFPAGRYPARTAFATVGLVLDARVEVECVAAVQG